MVFNPCFQNRIASGDAVPITDVLRFLTAGALSLPLEKLRKTSNNFLVDLVPESRVCQTGNTFHQTISQWTDAILAQKNRLCGKLLRASQPVQHRNFCECTNESAGWKFLRNQKV